MHVCIIRLASRDHSDPYLNNIKIARRFLEFSNFAERRLQGHLRGFLKNAGSCDGAVLHEKILLGVFPMKTQKDVRHCWAWTGAIFVLAIWGSIELKAQCEVQKLTPHEPTGVDEFGYSLSISENMAAVGAPGQGVIFVYRLDKGGLSPLQTLDAFNGAGNGNLGYSVSMTENIIVAGAPFDNCEDGLNCGAAYVFRFDGTRWNMKQKLTAHDASAFDRFGAAVSVNGDFIVIGAPSRDHCNSGYDCGAAYVFRFNGNSWESEDLLLLPAEGTGYYLGTAVAASTDRVIVGAFRYFPDSDTPAGAAFIYHFDGTTWSQEQQLGVEGGTAANFGTSVALNGRVAIVGESITACPAGNSCGAAYIYLFNGKFWEFKQKLVASDAEPYASFGESVSTSGDIAVIGSSFHSGYGRRFIGAAYVYGHRMGTWLEEWKLEASDAEDSDRLGYSVTSSPNRAIVGAVWADCAAGFDCGSAYVFEIGPDCDGNGQADFCDIRDGEADDGDSDGVPDECELVASMDIEPGKCPNVVRPRERGVIEAALAGSEAFDVTQVDADSVELRRADGIGSAIQTRQPRIANGRGAETPLGPPLSRGEAGRLGGVERPRRKLDALPRDDQTTKGEDRLRIRDVATFHENPVCTVGASNDDAAYECQDDGRDGFDDLILNFDAKELVQAFELDKEASGTSIEVEIVGALLDGTIFRATDCIVIGGREGRDGR